MFKNWKTLFTGLATIGTAVLHAVTTGVLDAMTVTQIITGIGLVFSKDFNVTGGGTKPVVNDGSSTLSIDHTGN